MPLYFDKEIVTIILDNLISNAIKIYQKPLVCVKDKEFILKHRTEQSRLPW